MHFCFKSFPLFHFQFLPVLKEFKTRRWKFLCPSYLHPLLSFFQMEQPPRKSGIKFLWAVQQWETDRRYLGSGGEAFEGTQNASVSLLWLLPGNLEGKSQKEFSTHFVNVQWMHNYIGVLQNWEFVVEMRDTNLPPSSLYCPSFFGWKEGDKIGHSHFYETLSIL